MGYVRKKTVKIGFGEGHEFEGLEVRVRVVGVGRFLELLPKISRLDSIDDIADADEDELAELHDAIRELSGLLAGWNIEDEDAEGNRVPVPCTHEALLEQDLRLFVAVMQAWAEHLSGVPAPLGEPPSSGDPSLEGSIPMDVSSPSQPS